MTEPSSPPPVPLSRRARRREKLARRLRASGLDALLVAAVPNVSYLTGFTGDSSHLLVMRDRAVLVSDGRYEEQLHAECPDLEVVIRPVDRLLLPVLAATAKALGIARLGVEADHLSLADAESLREALPTTGLVAVQGLVESLRAVKDRFELGLIRASIGMAERAFTMLRAGLRPDDTEKDVADDLEGFLRRCGATGASFPPIVGAGPNAALPHYRPSAATRLEAADFVLIDWGATGFGYQSDLTRVIATGKVTTKFEAVYRCVLAAQERAIAAIRPGVSAGAIDAAARGVIADAGYGRFFGHGLGHGLGLEIHEAPRMRPGADAVLAPGMVVTVEPGIYLPGWGGVRIEDDVLVTPEGCEILTRVPRSLETVRP
jgi:Xaa-Pro aminopeptidase